MFLALTNAQSGEAVALLELIDNRCGDLQVGLRSITFTVGWYNVEHGESISWRHALTNDSHSCNLDTTEVSLGLYSQGVLTKFLEEAAGSEKIKISTNRLNGLMTLTVGSEWEFLLTDGLLMLVVLEDGWGVGVAVA